MTDAVTPVARPPLANDRLEKHPDGRLLLRLKTRWRDGTTHVLMERNELIDRLVPLIPENQPELPILDHRRSGESNLRAIRRGPR